MAVTNNTVYTYYMAHDQSKAVGWIFLLSGLLFKLADILMYTHTHHTHIYIYKNTHSNAAVPNIPITASHMRTTISVLLMW